MIQCIWVRSEDAALLPCNTVPKVPGQSVFLFLGFPRGFRASGAAKAFARAYLAIGVKICGPRTQRSRSNSFSEKCPRCEIRRIAEEALSEHCVELGSGGDKTRPDYSGYQD